MGLILKLLHVLTAIWLISGMVGRAITFWQATKRSHVQGVHALLQASDFFERQMVIPASAAVLLLGLLTAWWQNWPLFGFLQGAGSNWLLVSLILYLALTPAIPLYLIPRRKERAQAADEALTHGQITPELAAALADKGVSRYRTVEFLVMTLITILMVTKPF